MRDAEFATDHEADALPQAACERRLSEFYRPSMGKVLVHTEKRGPAFEVANQTMRLVRALDRHVFTCSDPGRSGSQRGTGLSRT